MRIVALVLIIILLGGLVMVTGRSSFQKNASAKNLAQNLNSGIKTSLSDLSQNANSGAKSQIEGFAKNFQEYADATAKKVVGQVASDAGQMASLVTNMVIAQQIIHTFNGLNIEGKTRVREEICR